MIKIKRVFFVSLICLLSLIAIFASINVYVVIYSRQYMKTELEKVPDVDAIIVLGAYVFPSGQVSMMLRDRLEASLQAYGDVSSKIIVSGDHGHKSYNEVRAMKNYLMAMNIDEKDIFMDHAGFSTYDTINRAKNVFLLESTVICTQKYHLYRAVYIARKLGIEAYGFQADHYMYPGMRYYELRESFARVKDFFYVLFGIRPKFLGPIIDIRGSGLQTEDLEFQ